MNLYERLHALQRLARYRWRTERAELRYLRSRRIEGGSVLDIGAFRGVYSYWMHRWFASGTQVVAFEPQQDLIPYLQKMKQSFALERLWIEPAGLSSQNGTLRMHRPIRHWAAASVDAYCVEDDSVEAFEIPVTTIDDFLALHPELRPVHFIKCDVANHETEVLAGAAKTLREDRPELLVDWSTPRRSYRERFVRLTQHLGYSIFQFECGKTVPCPGPERHVPPSWDLGPNYLLVPMECRARLAA